MFIGARFSDEFMSEMSEIYENLAFKKLILEFNQTCARKSPNL